MAPFNPAKVYRIPLFFLVVLAVLGLLLRWQMVGGLPFNYRYFVHAHSHTAFMGWVYNAIFLLAIHFFVPPESRGRRFLRYFIWAQVGVVGMLLSFPFQGYGAVSIAFSTLHLVVTVLVAITFFRRLSADRSSSARFLRWALVYQLLSGVGPLLLGPLSAMGMKDSPCYSLAIYFFMHFQFNGWFVLGCLALLFRWLETNNWQASRRHTKWLTYGLCWTVAPAYLMSALWTEAAGLWMYIVAIATALAQIGGVFLLLSLVWNPVMSLISSVWTKSCLLLAMLLLGAKYLLQLAGSIPGIDDWVFANQGLIIAFIHLIFIGVVSFMLLGFYLLTGWLRPTWHAKAGLVFFLAGFVVTEVVLVGQPVFSLADWLFPVPYFAGLLAGAGLMLAGSLLLLPGTKGSGVASSPLDGNGKPRPAAETNL